MNRATKVLTIAVPTFNRRDALLEQVRAAVSDRIPEFADVMVVDDGSSDGTEAALRDEGLMAAVKYVRNPVNQGYPLTFLEVFDRCSSQYVMLSADDDFLVADGIAELVRRLTKGDLVLASPVFRSQEGRAYRGRESERPITPSEVRSALNHAPGLTYSVAHARQHTSSVRQRSDRGCSMARTYPQVLLGVLLARQHRGSWLPMTTMRAGVNLASGIKDAHGNSYYSAKSRFAQILDFDEFLTETIGAEDVKAPHGFVRAVLAHHRRLALRSLLGAISRQAPELATELVRQSSLLALTRPRYTLRAWLSTRPTRRTTGRR